MTIHAISDLIALIVNFLFGIYVYKKNPGTIPTKIFALLMLSICIWQFGEFNLVSAKGPDYALFWDRFLYIGLILAPNTSFVLGLVFPHQRALTTGRLKMLVLFAPSLFLFSLLPTQLFVSGVQLEYWGFGKIIGPLYWLFRIHMLVFVALTLAAFFYSYKTAKTGRERIQCKYLMGAISIPGIMGILILTILQPLGLKDLNMSVSSVASVIMTGILSYAMVKHRLMDVDVVLRKGTVYGLSLIAIVLPLSVILLYSHSKLSEHINYPFSIIAILVISASSVFFAILKPYAERTVVQKIFKGRYSYQVTLTKFCREIVTIIDLKSLLRKLIETTTSTMNIDKASIFIFEDEKGKYVLQDHKNLEKTIYPELISLSSTSPLVLWLKTTRDIIVREEWEKSKNNADLEAAIKEMKSLESEICIPLSAKKGLIGIICFGKKLGNGIYSDEDIALLETLANQTTIAIENAKLYETLKKQKAIMRRADRLASLGTLTAGLAHEIRNPLVAIKTLTQLLPERLHDEEFRTNFLAIASGEVDRISSLVNELLEFARPPEPKLRPEDVGEIMNGMILLVSIEAKKKDLDVISQYEENLPPILIDREQIRQVFLNILLNAIQATSEGGRIDVQIRSFVKEGGQKFIQVEIHDTGAGISEEHIEHIFTPFFTTKEKGSGLGLPISNQIVQEHQGTITVESRSGAGSSFFIDLPIRQREGEEIVASEKQSEAVEFVY